MGEESIVEVESQFPRNRFKPIASTLQVIGLGALSGEDLFDLARGSLEVAIAKPESFER
jgi:hypothetical protein